MWLAGSPCWTASCLLWIFLAMAVGVGLGYVFPSIATAFDALRI